jgi:hypothetical protein
VAELGEQSRRTVFSIESMFEKSVMLTDGTGWIHRA